jgi:hypothetical protein
VQGLSGKLNLVNDKIADLEDLLREHMSRSDAIQKGA